MDLDLTTTCVRFRYGGFADNFGSLINPGTGPDTRAASSYRPKAGGGQKSGAGRVTEVFQSSDSELIGGHSLLLFAAFAILKCDVRVTIRVYSRVAFFYGMCPLTPL